MKRWISPKEFEEEFGMCVGTQSNKRSKGELPYTKFGGMVKYDRLKIDELFEAHHVDVAS